MKSEYTYNNGYFFEKGLGREHTRDNYSENPLETAREFYDKLTYGGIESEFTNGKGLKTRMSDGTIVSFRETSTSDGSPVVEINIQKSSNYGDLKQQKIHFVLGGNKEWKTFDMRFSKDVISTFINKEMKKYKCNQFVYTSSVHGIVGIYIDDKIL